MRHLVLVTAHYPPATTAGARRPFNLVRAFRTAGWRVSVVTTGEPTTDWDTGSLGEAVWRIPVPGQFSRATTRVPPGRSDAPTRRSSPWRTLRARLRRQVVAARCFPDLWRDAEAPMVAAIRARITDPSSTVLLSTAPPITVHQAAAQVHRIMPGLPWVAEYRDPWIEPGSQAVRWEGTYKAGAGRRLLRRLLSGADRNVAVSEGIAQWLRARGAQRVDVALNGIPDEMLEAVSADLDPGVIRYVGEFYLGRDPAPLFESLERLARAGRLPADFRLELIGDVASSPGGATADLLACHGIESHVTLTGRVPHHEAIAAVRRAGGLVLLASEQPTQVPNKLYEYLGAGRPILAVVDLDGESHRLLKAAGMGASILTPTSTPADWDAALERIIAASRQPSTSWAGVEGLRTTSQLARVVGWCQELLTR